MDKPKGNPQPNKNEVYRAWSVVVYGCMILIPAFVVFLHLIGAYQIINAITRFLEMVLIGLLTVLGVFLGGLAIIYFIHSLAVLLAAIRHGVSDTKGDGDGSST